MRSKDFRELFLQAAPGLEKTLGRIMDPVLERAQLTRAEFAVLTGVESGLVQTVGALGKATGMGQANVSSLCKRMEQKGLLTRTRSRQDERVVHLAATDEGLRRLAVTEEACGYFDGLLARVPAQDLEAIVRGIEALQRTLAYLSETMEKEENLCLN